MRWLVDRAATIRDALSVQRVLALPIIFAVVTAAIHLAPVIAEREPMFLSMPAWMWGFVAFLLLLLYFVIEHATRLRLRLLPKLKLSFNPNEEGIAQTPTNIERMASYVRIRVEALSATTVKGCTASLVGLDKRVPPSSEFVPIPLDHGMALRDQPFDVFPNVRSTVDFLVCIDNINKLTPTGYWPFSLRGAFDDVATYRFTIAVNGDGLTTKTQVDIDWRGAWDTITGRPVVPLP